MRSRTITYHNEGVPLAATLYLPDEIERGRRLPGVILLTGYIATQKIALPDVAAYYTERGYAALAVDYRGFGKSGGPRWRLMCDERIRDTRMAITWFEGQSEVDPDRVGIYGSSFGGSIAVAVAAIDRRARAIVCLGSPSDGESWMASQRSLSEWMAFRRRVDEDTKRRCAGGESEWLDHYREFVPLDAAGIAFTATRHAADPEFYGKLSLESAQDTIDFKPINVVDRIAPRAVLILHGDSDTRVPLQHATDLYRRAGEPKRLCVLRNATHYDVTNPGPRFAEVLDLSRDWFDRYLAVRDPTDGSRFL